MARTGKKTIPGKIRVALAWRHGCLPGESIEVKCHYCEFIGSMWWHLPKSGKISTWVHFTGLEMDHVIPEFLGGEATEENIVLACRPCNRRKGFRVEVSK